jgi:hypothetical protein
MREEKYNVSIPEAILNDITNIKCFFKNLKGKNNYVFNAFVLAFTDDNVEGQSDFSSTEDSNPDNCRPATFRLPSWLFDAVKKKYEKKHGEKLHINETFKYVLADALSNPHYRINLDKITPAFNFVGQKNEKMCIETGKILQSRYSEKNLLYAEPFCGSAALFLSLPLQPTWKYILNDCSKNKVNLLRAIKYHPYELVEKLLASGYDPNDYITETELPKFKSKKSKGKKPKTIPTRATLKRAERSKSGRYKSKKFKMFNPKKREYSDILEDKLKEYIEEFKNFFPSFNGTEKELLSYIEWFEKNIFPTWHYGKKSISEYADEFEKFQEEYYKGKKPRKKLQEWKGARQELENYIKHIESISIWHSNRKELTAYIDWYEEYINDYLWGAYNDEYKKKLLKASNTYQRKYNSSKVFRISELDNKRYENNHCVDTAVYFLIHSAMVGRTKKSHERFMKCIESIPLISAKLNQADANILWGDGVKAIDIWRKAQYKNYKPLLVIDPPYIGSEEQCDDLDGFSKRHKAVARAIYRLNEHGYFLYFCRTTCPLRYKKEERIPKDIALNNKINYFFTKRGYHRYDFQLRKKSPTDWTEIVELMITNFKHEDSKPYL